MPPRDFALRLDQTVDVDLARLRADFVPDPRRVASAVGLWAMCRNIRTLHNFEPPATEDEVHAAALQYVRKISGYSKPSQANDLAFARAVGAVAEASLLLLDELVTTAPPRDREHEAARAAERAAQRFGRVA